MIQLGSARHVLRAPHQDLLGQQEQARDGEAPEAARGHGRAVPSAHGSARVYDPEVRGLRSRVSEKSTRTSRLAKMRNSCSARLHEKVEERERAIA